MLTQDRQQKLVFEPRFQGLPGIAHGGYLAGALAAELGVTSAEVRLRRPAPTGRSLTLVHGGSDAVELRDGGDLLAEAEPAELALGVPARVTPAQAEVAARGFHGLHAHLFPDCIVCGTGRHDGLGIFPGPVAGQDVVAAPWVPAPDHADGAGAVRDELVWASLDCTQLWALIDHVPADNPDLVLTAALATRLERPVMAGEPHVVVGWPIGREGRTWLAGAAVIGPDGELCAIGRQTAVVTRWGVPLGRDHHRRDHPTTAGGTR